MFKIKLRQIYTSILACFIIFGAGVFTSNSFDFAAAAENLAAGKKQKLESIQSETNKPCNTILYLEAKPLDVVANPARYLNQNIKMDATFDKFSTLGLDYKPALRENANYIGFLIQRDDVVDHDVPLSEMKLFLKKEYAEKLLDLETGDKIQIKGKVFSNALSDPWIDVDEIVVTKKAKIQEETKEIKK